MRGEKEAPQGRPKRHPDGERERAEKMKVNFKVRMEVVVRVSSGGWKKNVHVY